MSTAVDNDVDSEGGLWITGIESPAGPRPDPLDLGTTRQPRQQVDVRRSARRHRTVAAYRDGAVVVVLIPARFSRAEEGRWVERMVADVLAREERARSRGPKAGDATLLRRAQDLNRRYFDGAAEPATVRWVATMAHRWGSCTAADRSIRLSTRLRDFPAWVVDYVLVHELAHLLVAAHDDAFWRLVNGYERTERARGYLEGRAAAAQRAEGPASESPSADPAGGSSGGFAGEEEESDGLF